MHGERIRFRPLTNVAFALLAVFAAMAPAASRGADVFVECESFDDLGGWVVDAYSMRAMGSSYVMAHGCGRPVADAVGRIAVPEKGRYSVWARTRNWNAEWTKGAAGLFKVRVGGVEMPQALGTGDAAWRWRKAGEVDLSPGPAEVALHDLTGFNGRCDAIFLTTRPLDTRSAEAAAESARTIQRGKVVEDREEWDMVVVGGGVAGCCAALSASRYKLKTLLLQDRGVLGGCNSSEIRVSAGGYMHKGPYPALGNVLEEILPVRGDYLPLSAKFYEDDRKANAFSYPEMTARLKLNKYVYAVETNSEGRVVAVISRDTRTGRDTRHRARWFTDATGDGVVARMAGCATMYGREARSRWNEACAPVKADRQVMGHSIQWLTRTEKNPVPFPDIDWGLPFTEETVRYVRRGSWWQEAGQYRDMADETEAIRDYGLLAIFSNWSFLKNHSARRKEWSRLAFDWISPIGGKRESHRVVGDYILTETDLESQRKFEDGTAVVTWDIDFHFPDPDNAKRFKEPFRSCAYHRGFGPPVAVPYRCLYAKDAPNIFLAGRDISTSHGAFAAVRVQRTLGMLGEVVGIAAGICREKSCDPRDVYRKHLPLLKERMKKGVPKFRQYCAFGGGMHEKYHFADLGFVSIWPNPATNLSPRVVEAIRSLGMNHRHRHPQIDGESGRKTDRRRFVLADESRARLHYWDSADPSFCFSIPGERPMWDLKRVGELRYRTVCKKGFKVFDLNARKVVDEFRHPLLDEVTAVCDMPDGGFVASVNPRTGPDRNKTVLLRRFSKDRKPIATYRCDGFFYARSLQWDRDGKTLLLSWEKGFARIRIPESGDKCEIVGDFRQPKGRNLFDVVPLLSGDGYLAGCGYGGGLVRFGKDGKALSSWFVPELDGCRSLFYAQPKQMPDGHVYMAHWTGHGAKDSSRGWQVVEFDRDGNAVWHLHDPDRFGSVSGIDVLDDDVHPQAPMHTYVVDFNVSSQTASGGVVTVSSEGAALVCVPTPRAGASKRKMQAFISKRPVDLKSLRTGKWMVKGEYKVSGLRLEKVEPVYDTVDGVELGEGEAIFGNAYHYSPTPLWDGRHGSVSRPLADYAKCYFHNGQWRGGKGASITWRHSVAGRRLSKAKARLAVSKSSAPWTVEVSVDGSGWRTVPASGKTGARTEFSLPDGADIKVRVRFGGEKGFMLFGYDFVAMVNGAPCYRVGRTDFRRSDGSVLRWPDMPEKPYAKGEMLSSVDGVMRLWTADAGWKVFPENPLPSGRTDAVRIRTAANETECSQLVVTPVRPLTGVRATIADVPVCGKFALPEASIEILKVTYVNVRIPTDSTCAPGLWPDPIERQSPEGCSVAAGESRSFWVRVKPPKGTRPGLYRGSLELRAEGIAPQRVPFEVEVFGFELPDVMTCETAFGCRPHNLIRQCRLKKTEDRRKMFDMYFRILADHRITVYTPDPTTTIKAEWKGLDDPKTAEPVFNWSEWDAGIEKSLREYHANTIRIPCKGLGGGTYEHRYEPEIAGFKEGTAEYDILLKKYLGGIESHLKEKGWLDKSYVYWFDEPRPKDYAFCTNGFAKLKRYAPGIRRMLTAEAHKTLLDSVNLWCPVTPNFHRGENAAARAKGDRFWWYVCCSPTAPYATEFIDKPGVEMRVWLWQTWKENVDGILIWDTIYWSGGAAYKGGFQNCWEDTQCWCDSSLHPYPYHWGNGDGRFLYPPRSSLDRSRKDPVLDPPVETYRLEMLRDGIEDYEYFAILRGLDPDNALLTVPPDVTSSMTKFSLDPVHMSRHRLRLAREIERLSAGR